MRVLLVVDVQNDFCPNGALGVPEGDQVVAVINRLMKSGEYDLIIATADRHPLNHISFAVNHRLEPFSEVLIDGKLQKVWPVHCVERTWGAEFHPKLCSELFDYTVIKGDQKEYDSLSGFCDLKGERYTQLAEIIDQAAAARGETRADVQLSVTGLALDYCVGLSALDGARLGYRTEVVIDATRPVNQDPRATLELLREFTRNGVSVVESLDRIPERIVRNLEIAL